MIDSSKLRARLTLCITDLNNFFPSTTYPLPHLRLLITSLKFLDSDIDTSPLTCAIAELVNLRKDLAKLYDTTDHPTMMALSVQILKAHTIVLRRLYHEQQEITQRQTERTGRLSSADIDNSGTDSSADAVTASPLNRADSLPADEGVLNEIKLNGRVRLLEVRDEARRMYGATLRQYNKMIEDFCSGKPDRQAQTALRKNWVMMKEANALRDEAKILAWTLGLEAKKL